MERNHIKNRELFSTITHEIKNSLNPVINLSSILLRNTADRLTADENSYLEAIERNGKRILNLVEEFSFLNKLRESDRSHKKDKKYPCTEVHVGEEIDSAFRKMTETGNHPGREMFCEISKDSSVIITEKEVFRRILDNICLFFFTSGNDIPAFYFTTVLSGQEFHLIFSCEKTALNLNDRIVFDRDKITGKGFSESSVMWLQFAALYVYHLKGEAFFSHSNENDAVFSFSIPAGTADIEKAEEDIVSANDSVKGTVHVSGRSFVMLVIDDDIDNIIPVTAIIENEFKGMGKVYYAESGGKGLDLLEKIRPDIILLDLTLPDISGLALVRNIKNLFVKEHIPVIAFSGLDIAGDKAKMTKSGFDDVIRKPFNIDTFIHIIRKWID